MLDRLCVVPVAILAGWCVVPLAGQQPPSLDRPIQGDVRVPDPRTLPPCASGTAVDLLARAAHVLVGFENTPDCFLSPRLLRAGDASETLTGVTVRQAFDHLIGLMPMFSWKELDSVIVVRPTTAWTDPDDLLNQPVQSFEVNDALADEALHALLRAGTPSLLLPHTDVPRFGKLNSRRLTLSFEGGTLLQALNAFVRGHGSAAWQVGGYAGGRPLIIIHTLDFPGDNVMAPAAFSRRSQ